MPFDPETLAQRFRRLAPAGVDHASLRVVEEHSNMTRVRQDVVEPSDRSVDRGAMATVVAGDGIGYAATSDLSDAGLRAAIVRAAEWARLARGRNVFDAPPRLPQANGRYATAAAKPLALTGAEGSDLLRRESKACRIDDRVVDWEASLWTVRVAAASFCQDSLACSNSAAFPRSSSFAVRPQCFPLRRASFMPATTRSRISPKFPGGLS